jgi:hypothetical protein
MSLYGEETSDESRTKGLVPAHPAAFRRFASFLDEPSRRLRFFSVAPASSRSSSEKSPSESDIVGQWQEGKGDEGSVIVSR